MAEYAYLIYAGVAAIAGGVAASESSKARRQSANANAMALEYNAKVGRQKSEAALRAASMNEDQQRRQNRYFMGRQRAAIAESGTGLGGSNADVELQSEIAAELDALNIRYGGAVDSAGALSGATLSEMNAATERGNAKTAAREGTIGIVSSLIGSVGSYYGYQSRTGGAKQASQISVE